MNDVMRLIKDTDLQIIEQQFDNNCSIQVSIRKTQVNTVLAKLDKIAGVKAKYDYSL
jgi:putative IMPACT (imprinted ancient) family translation regulator